MLETVMQWQISRVASRRVLSVKSTIHVGSLEEQLAAAVICCNARKATEGLSQG